MDDPLRTGGRCKAARQIVRLIPASIRAAAPLSVFLAAGLADPASAADKFYVAASPTGQQTIRYVQGVAELYDQGTTTVVRVVEVAAPDGRIALDITVANRRRTSINVGPENVQISTVGGKSLAIVPYEQLIAKEEKRQKGQRFWARVGAAGRAMSANGAGTTVLSGDYTGFTNGFVGGAPYMGQTMGSFRATYDDPVAEAAAKREVAATNAAIAEALATRQARDLAAYDAVLRTTTIDPGRMVHGTVQFDVPKELRRAQAAVSLQMTVTVNGEVHPFSGQLRKVEG